MSKFILKFLIFCLFNILLFHKAFAIDDGVYTGVYKTIYAHGDSDSKKGDSGVFEFTIKNDKVVKLFAYDDPNWKFYGIKPNFKINPNTNELSGYASGNDPTRGSYNVRFKINMKGIFIDKKFAGEGNVELTSPESLILEKFIFESLD